MKDLKVLAAEIYADGKIEKEEFVKIQEVKDEAYAEGNDVADLDIFYAAVGCDYFLNAGATEEAAEFLIEQINEDGETDDAETLLVEKLVEVCEDRQLTVPACWTEAFEEILG